MQFSGNLLHLAYNPAINVTQGLSGPASSQTWSRPCARYRHLVIRAGKHRFKPIVASEIE